MSMAQYVTLMTWTSSLTDIWSKTGQEEQKH